MDVYAIQKPVDVCPRMEVGSSPIISVEPSADEVAVSLARPMSYVPGYFEVINTHTVGSLTIPRASIKWV